MNNPEPIKPIVNRVMSMLTKKQFQIKYGFNDKDMEILEKVIKTFNGKVTNVEDMNDAT